MREGASAQPPDGPALRFACIEFQTKSGTVWRGDGPPNYLCDPSREIDPTSFGCWTSALRGEHLPVAALERPGPLARWRGAPSLAAVTGEIRPDRLRLWWCLDRLLPRPSYSRVDRLEGYDLVLVTLHCLPVFRMVELLDAIHRLRSRPIILGALALPFHYFRETWGRADAYRAFADFGARCDAFVSWHRQLVPYLQAVIPSPVVYLPLPYPVEHARTFGRPPGEKEPFVLVPGDTQRMDTVATFLAARELQRRRPEILIRVVDTRPGNLGPLESTRREIVPRMPWQDYLRLAARARLVLSLDTTWTKGRVPTDAAAVTTPAIGANADSQIELFPDLVCADAVGLVRAVDLAERLCADVEFASGQCAPASRRLEAYGYEPWSRRLEELVRLIRAGELDRWQPLGWEASTEADLNHRRRERVPAVPA